MASYILLASYTEQGIKGIKDTVKRTGAVKDMAKKAGVDMKESYWTLGQFDVVALFEAPDDATMTAFAFGRQARQRQDADLARLLRQRDVGHPVR
jgi:uncharacterized protein with GYD domain